MANLKDTIIKGVLTVFGKIKVNNGIEGNLKGNVDGTATKATKLDSERTFSFKGDLTGSANTDLSSNVEFNVVVNDDSHNHTMNTLIGILPIEKGGTGASKAADALINLGINATAAELNHIKGVTSGIQGQLNEKVNKVNGKGLSTNDFTNEYKQKIDNINQEVATSSSVKFKKVTIDNAFEISYNSTTKSLDFKSLL